VQDKFYATPPIIRDQNRLTHRLHWTRQSIQIFVIHEGLFMKVPDSRAPEELSWVDFCDSLRNEPAPAIIQSQKPIRIPKQMPDPAAIANTRREMVADSH
jgi:hypothetical protein